MRKPRLSKNTIAKLEIYGYAESGKNYYELKNYIVPKGNVYTTLEWTDLRTGDVKTFDWEKFTKEA